MCVLVDAAAESPFMTAVIFLETAVVLGHFPQKTTIYKNTSSGQFPILQRQC